MQSIQLSNDIVSMSELKSQVARLLRRVNEERRPVVITRHGRPAGVLIAPEEFDRLAEHDRFVDAVRQGLADSRRGRLLDDAEIEPELTKALKAQGKK